MTSLVFLSDQDLLDVYNKAIQCGLDCEFIHLLMEELKRRGLVEKSTVC